MREYTVVRQLREAAYDISPIVKTTFDICYKDGTGAIRWVSSNCKSKDDMVSLLFDLSLSGHYVSSVKIVRFKFEHSIQVYFHQSENMRTNLKTELIEQISQILDKVKKE
jgi:hypothetical protein